MLKYSILVLVGLLGVACQDRMAHRILSEEDIKSLPQASAIVAPATIDPVTKQVVLDNGQPNTDTIAIAFDGQYHWLTEDYQIQTSLSAQVPVPHRYRRIAVEKGSFAEWLRFLPMLPKGTTVKLHDGSVKPYQAGAYQVVDIDVGKRDLQQCADAVMRLRAEYLYSQKQYSDIHFNYTSGHTIKYSDWVVDKRPRVKGNKVYFSNKNESAEADYSYFVFREYLQSIYLYAGTSSLSQEMTVRRLQEMQIGDVFIKGGFPGHAMIVLDMAQSMDNDEKVFLLGQSYMPAQSIHIVNNFHDLELSPWYAISQVQEELITPEWTFAGNQLKTFQKK